MPIPSQIISINLGFGGIDNRTDDTRVSPDRLIEGKNLRFNKLGRLDKRNGTEAWTNQSVIVYSKLLLNQESDITAFTDAVPPIAYNFNTTTGTGEAQNNESVVPLASLYSLPGGPQLPNKNPYAWDGVETVNYRYIATVVQTAALVGLYVQVYEKASNKQVYQHTFVQSQATGQLRLLAPPSNSDSVLLGWMNVSGTRASLNMYVVSSTNSTACTNWSMTGLFNSCWDWTTGASTSLSNGFLAATVFNSATTITTRLGPIPTMANATVAPSITNTQLCNGSITMNSTIAVGVSGYHNASLSTINRVRVAWYDNTSGKAINYSTTLSVVNSAITLSIQGSTPPKFITGTTTLFGSTVWLYDSQAAQSYNNAVHAWTYNGSSGGSLNASVTGMSLVSKVCSAPNTDTVFFMTCYDLGLQKTNFLYSYDTNLQALRTIGKANYGVANGTLTRYLQMLPSLQNVSSSTSATSDAYITTAPRFVRTFVAPSASGFNTLKDDFTITESLHMDFKNNGWRSINLRDETIYTGGFLGRLTSTLPPKTAGPQLYPELISGVSLTGSGGLTTGTYLVTACYETMDSAGRVNQSAPATPLTVSITQSAMSVTVTTYMLNDGLQSTSIGLPRLAMYRTLVGQTDTYYRCATYSGVNNGVATINVALTISDATIAQSEPLYTQGGVQPNFIPECPIAIAANSKRVLVVSGTNPNHIYQSKPVVPGEAVAFIEQYGGRDIAGYGPRITALSNFFDKWIAWKESSTFIASGDGIDATGSNDTLSEFELLSDNIGCADTDSVMETNYGIIFKSKKGFYILRRNLQLDYIGAAVEEYNDIDVRSVTFDKDNKIIYFVLDSDETLVLTIFETEEAIDFRWTVDTNTLFNSEIVANGTKYSAFNYVASSSIVKTSDGYVDYGSSVGITRTITTNWTKVADLQGFQRVRQALFLGDANTSSSTSQIQVDIGYDYQDTYNESKTVTVADATYNGTTLQWSIKPKKQKCEAIRFRITDLNPDNNSNWYLKQLQLVIGVKSPDNKMSKFKGG